MSSTTERAPKPGCGTELLDLRERLRLGLGVGVEAAVRVATDDGRSGGAEEAAADVVAGGNRFFFRLLAFAFRFGVVAVSERLAKSEGRLMEEV
jgi:hypothetical protein